VVKEVAAVLARLHALSDHPLVGETRGLGLMGAVELVADKTTKRSFDARARIGARAAAFAEDEGVLLRILGGDSVALCPPLVISPDEIDDMFERLSRALDRTLSFAKCEQLLAS
jgi:4-aminobutyrate--pyruvate transaminase